MIASDKCIRKFKMNLDIELKMYYNTQKAIGNRMVKPEIRCICPFKLRTVKLKIWFSSIYLRIISFKKITTINNQCHSAGQN